MDFKLEDEIRNFCDESADPKKIIEYISLRKGRKIDSRILLIFDEVQECPNIISLLKYFCQDYREIPVIATGSMVRIRLTRSRRGKNDDRRFLFPAGKINQITLYPMTIEKYLMNLNPIMYEMI